MTSTIFSGTVTASRRAHIPLRGRLSNLASSSQRRPRPHSTVSVVAAACLAVAAVLAPTTASAASGTASTTRTSASCVTHWPAYQHILTANHPTGTTSGVTYLAARLQGKSYSGSVHNIAWQTFTNGRYWISTNATRFPYGHFWNGSQWYRGSAFAFGFYSGIAQYRIQWLVRFSDGSRVYRYSNWVMCG